MEQSPKTETKPARARSYVGWTVFFLTLALMVAFFAGLLPAAPVVVATGSMEPGIGVGDVVIVCPVDPEELAVGDVIRYQGEGCTVIHRIVAIDGDSFTTQGDANNAPDLHPVEKDQVLGRVVCTIPHAGTFTLWLHQQLS